MKWLKLSPDTIAQYEHDKKVKPELRRQHQGNIATCKAIQEYAAYFRKYGRRTSIQINRQLDTASPRDVVRKLKANGFKFESGNYGKNNNGKIVFWWRML